MYIKRIFGDGLLLLSNTMTFSAVVSYPKHTIFWLNEKSWSEIVQFNQHHWAPTSLSDIVATVVMGSGYIKVQRTWSLTEELICLWHSSVQYYLFYNTVLCWPEMNCVWSVCVAWWDGYFYFIFLCIITYLCFLNSPLFLAFLSFVVKFSKYPVFFYFSVY
jgi:hypothetical protein